MTLSLFLYNKDQNDLDFNNDKVFILISYLIYELYNKTFMKSNTSIILSNFKVIITIDNIFK